LQTKQQAIIKQSRVQTKFTLFEPHLIKLQQLVLL